MTESHEAISESPEPEPSLRELKKQITRKSISDAALQLALEKGLDAITIDDIAHLAFMSPRTVSNYFSGKEEAVAAAGNENAEDLPDQFAQRPISEPPIQALHEILSDFMHTRTAEQLRRTLQKMELEAQYPALRPFQLAQSAKMEDALRDAIAARTGTDPETDLYPSLTAAVAIAAARTCMQVWAQLGAPHGKLPELLQTAFSLISDGLPSPPTPGER